MTGRAHRDDPGAESLELHDHEAGRLKDSDAVVVGLRQHHGRKAASNAALERIEIGDQSVASPHCQVERPLA